MTPRSAPRGAGVWLATLALACAAAGCQAGGGGGAERPPGAAGAGPYPTPSAPGAAGPLPTGSTGSTESTGPEETPESDASEPEGVDQVDQNDADAVSEGALSAMWTFDTATDAGPHEAALRAADAGWFTREYARALRGHRPRSVPGAEWEEWAGHHARTTVALTRTEDAARPVDTGTEAWRQWTVAVTPQGRDGWTGEPATVVAFVRLVREAPGAAWRVAEVAVR